MSATKFGSEMPPTRTVPPAKVVKTERTHEENQERYDESEWFLLCSYLTISTEPTLLLLGEAIEVSKRE